MLNYQRVYIVETHLHMFVVSQYLLISAEANLCDTGSAADPHSLGPQDAFVTGIWGCVLILWDVPMPTKSGHSGS